MTDTASKARAYALTVTRRKLETVTELDDGLPVGTDEIQRHSYTETVDLWDDDAREGAADMWLNAPNHAAPDTYEAASGVLGAVSYLLGEYVTAYSSEPFFPGGWYTARYEDPYTAEVSETTIRLDGFSDAEQTAVHMLLIAGDWRNAG